MKKLKKNQKREPIKITFTPFYEDSIEYERRIKEIQDLVAEIIILGMNEPDDVPNENIEDVVRPHLS